MVVCIGVWSGVGVCGHNWGNDSGDMIFLCTFFQAPVFYGFFLLIFHSDSKCQILFVNSKMVKLQKQKFFWF